MTRSNYDTLTNPEQILYCEQNDVPNIFTPPINDDDLNNFKLSDIGFLKNEAINPQLILCKTPDSADLLEDKFYDDLVSSPLNSSISLENNYITTTSSQGFADLVKENVQIKFSNPFQEEEHDQINQSTNTEIDIGYSPLLLDSYFGDFLDTNNKNINIENSDDIIITPITTTTTTTTTTSTPNNNQNNEDVNYTFSKIRARLGKRKLEENTDVSFDEASSTRRKSICSEPETDNHAPKVVKKNKRNSETQPYDANYWSKRNRESKISFDEEVAPDMIVEYNPSEQSLRRTSSTLSNILLRDFDYLEMYSTDSSKTNSKSKRSSFDSALTTRRSSKVKSEDDDCSPYSTSNSNKIENLYTNGSGNRRRKLGDEIHWKPSPAWALWELHKIFHVEQKTASKVLLNESSCFGLLNLRELGAWERGDNQHPIKRKR